MPWLALAWRHRSKAAVLVAALTLSLAACLPGVNPFFPDSSSWSRNAVVSSQALARSSLWDPASTDIDDRLGGELGQAYDAGFRWTAGSLLPHQPVVILSDQDFVSQKWPGSGTAENPYRIENLEITFPAGNCIEIRSTTAHFRVRGCSLTGTNQGCGAYLRDVVNGVLENNTCVVGVCGICLENSEACQVVDNTCRMAVYGIRLNLCQSVNVTDNICQASSAAGIRIYESQGINTARNMCIGNPYGIEIHGGTANDVSENTCVGSSAGILLNATRTPTASMNDCSASAIGIWLQDSSDGTLTQNTCEGNTGSGVLVARSHFNNLVSNVLRHNKRGIELTSAISNYVGGNMLEDNTESGVRLYLSESNRVDANTISGSAYGVHAVASHNNAVTVNSLSNNTSAGILLVESDMGTINHNVFVNCGLDLQGESYYAQREVRNNTVNGAPLVFLQNQRGASVPAGAGQVILLECRSVTMDHQTLMKTSIGLLVIYCRFVTIEDCVFAENTRCGVEIWWSRGVLFSDNSFLANGECGILLHSDCSDNSVRESLFANNGVHNAVDDGALNIFDRNFWSDYVGADLDLDGLGDDPYLISGQAMNRDWNPLMTPPGLAPPAQLSRWILSIAVALVVNSLIIGIGLTLVLRYRKWILKSTGKP